MRLAPRATGSKQVAWTHQPFPTTCAPTCTITKSLKAHMRPHSVLALAMLIALLTLPHARFDASGARASLLARESSFAKTRRARIIGGSSAWSVRSKHAFLRLLGVNPF